MKSAKKLLSLILAIMLILAPAAVSAADDEVIFSTKANADETLTISGFTGNAVNISVPKEIDGKAVTAIGDNAFKEATSLKTVTLPEGVTDIGINAFYRCTALESINAPLSLISIGTSAFEGCVKLDIAGFIDSSAIEAIGDCAFKGCVGSKILSMPTTLMSIGKSAFYGCTGIEEATLPSSLTMLDDWAFRGCTSLRSVTFGKGSQLDSIGKNAFTGCAIENIAIPEGTTLIDENAFSGTKLKRITIPASMEKINDVSFVKSDLSSAVEVYYTGSDEQWDALMKNSNAELRGLLFRLCFTADGIIIDRKYVCKGYVIKAPADPIKDYTTFEGWAREGSSAPVEYFTSMPEANQQFNAVFEPITYYARFADENGNLLDITPVPYIYTDTKITLPAVPQKEGHTGKWEDYTLTPGGITIKAQYSINTYYATFNYNGKSDTLPFVFGEQIKAPEIKTDEGFKIEWTPAVPSTMPAKSLEFKGECVPEVYEAKLVADGRVIKTIKYNYGQKSISLPAVPKKTGYTGKWEAYSLTPGGVTINAIYEINTYTITFVIDGVSTSEEYIYASPVTAPEMQAKQGYEFRWLNAIPSTMPAESITVKGSYICTGTVEIKANPGTKTINYGENLELTANAYSLPEGARLMWSAGDKKAEGDTFNTGTLTKDTVVTLTLADSSGRAIKNAEGESISVTENVKVSGGLFKIIISFFKNLFGADRTVKQ